MEISQTEYANHKGKMVLFPGMLFNGYPNYFLVTVELFSSSSKVFANKSNRLGGKKNTVSIC